MVSAPPPTQATGPPSHGPLFTRSWKHRANGYASGATAGAVCGSFLLLEARLLGHAPAALSMSSVGAKLLSQAVFGGISIGLFQDLLHNRTADSLRSSDFDPSKWSGALAAPALGAAAMWLLPPRAKFVPSVAMLYVGSAFVALTTYTHVANVAGVLSGSLGTGTLAIDGTATVLSACVIAALKHRQLRVRYPESTRMLLWTRSFAFAGGFLVSWIGTVSALDS